MRLVRLIPKPADIEVVDVGPHSALKYSVGVNVASLSSPGVATRWYVVRVNFRRGLIAISRGRRAPWWRRLLNRLLPPTYWEWP